MSKGLLNVWTEAASEVADELEIEKGTPERKLLLEMTTRMWTKVYPEIKAQINESYERGKDEVSVH